jgi:hypothetical protein
MFTNPLPVFVLPRNPHAQGKMYEAPWFYIDEAQVYPTLENKDPMLRSPKWQLDLLGRRAALAWYEIRGGNEFITTNHHPCGRPGLIYFKLMGWIYLYPWASHPDVLAQDSVHKQNPHPYFTLNRFMADRIVGSETLEELAQALRKAIRK